jgi:hypothetical protein
VALQVLSAEILLPFFSSRDAESSLFSGTTLYATIAGAVSVSLFAGAIACAVLTLVCKKHQNKKTVPPVSNE